MFLRYVSALCTAFSITRHLVQAVEGLLALLEKLSALVDEVDPIEQPMRFGNKAFRTWYTRVTESMTSMLQSALPDSSTVPGSADMELQLREGAAYLCDSFGNATRIDYGTGHETNFMLFLYVLRGSPPAPEDAPPSEADPVTPGGTQVLSDEAWLQQDDQQALALRVFPQYLRLCRKVQRRYMLEPAGSHGVWSLDDFQMLPFYFGSAQLKGSSSITPGDIHSSSVRSANLQQYMYMEGIEYIHSVKTGAPFAEHSPLLNDLSLLPNWKRVNVNMRNLYVNEVLGKQPVTQHIQFGQCLQCTWTPEVPAAAARAAGTNPSGSAGVMGVAPWAAAAASSAVQAPLPSHVGVAPWARK